MMPLCLFVISGMTLKTSGFGAGGAEKIYSWIKVPLGKTLSRDKYMYVTKESIFIPWIWNQPVCFSFVELMISICKLNGRSLLKRDWLFHREFIGQHNVKRRYTVAWSDQFLMRFIGKKFSIKNSLALKIECYCFVGIDLIRWMWSNLNYIISICCHLQEEERKEIMFIIFW